MADEHFTCRDCNRPLATVDDAKACDCDSPICERCDKLCWDEPIPAPIVPRERRWSPYP